MRKAHMQAVIDGLKKRVTEVERDRDEARGALHEGLTKLHAHAAAHSKGLAKLGDDVSGLAEAVRSSAKPAPATEAPAAEVPATAAEAPDAPAAEAPPARKAGAPGRNAKTPAAT